MNSTFLKTIFLCLFTNINCQSNIYQLYLVWMPNHFADLNYPDHRFMQTEQFAIHRFGSTNPVNKHTLNLQDMNLSPELTNNLRNSSITTSIIKGQTEKQM